MARADRGIYVKNAAVLTGTGFVLRAAGMALRVYLAGVLGAEGMGLYQLVLTVYGLAATVASAGLTAAAARVCAGASVAGPGHARAAAGRMTLWAALLGGAAGLVLAALAGPAARGWIGDGRTAAPLRVLAAGLPATAASAVLRGYFLARRQVRPASLAQLGEQAVRMGLSVALLRRAQGFRQACLAAAAGSAVGEAADWALLAVLFCRAGRGEPRAAAPAHLARRAAAIWAPMAGAQYLHGVLRTVENGMVPACLALFTGSRTAALAQYGALTGMALPLLFFPFSFLGTLSTLLLPDITRAHLQGDRPALQRLVGQVLAVTFSLGALAGGLFSLLGAPVARALYGDGQVGFYLEVLGPLMPLMYAESMVDGILKGLDQQLATFRYAAADSVLRIALIALLAPRLGMKGFLFVMLASNLLTSLLNLRRLLAVTGLPVRWGAWAARPAACFALAAFCWQAGPGPRAAQRWGDWGSTLAGGAFVTVLYLALWALTGGAAGLRPGRGRNNRNGAPGA